MTSTVKGFKTYDNNQTKAYGLLWERCAKAMKNKIEARADFGSMKNDPIELLKSIKEHASIIRRTGSPWQPFWIAGILWSMQ
jgi:hypothetical protein